MGETNSPSVAHVGYDISPLLRVKFNSLEWRNIVTQGQLKENLYIYISCDVYRSGQGHITGLGIRHQSDWLIVLHIPNACLASPPLCIYHLKFEWKTIIDRSFGGGERGIVLCFY